jgi:hypothetical protein
LPEAEADCIEINPNRSSVRLGIPPRIARDSATPPTSTAAVDPGVTATGLVPLLLIQQA